MFLQIKKCIIKIHSMLVFINVRSYSLLIQLYNYFECKIKISLKNSSNCGNLPNLSCPPRVGFGGKCIHLAIPVMTLIIQLEFRVFKHFNTISMYLCQCLKGRYSCINMYNILRPPACTTATLYWHLYVCYTGEFFCYLHFIFIYHVYSPK